ncbi:hypothetical protein F2Q70_00020840 [Brassica cretica]|uniref:Uncharacterized protein n=1 Tax=Brassica cretica TaxID=69181 RepID=A0A8S9GK07_BRACR|nr:hypothetical protein F2Q70_00020840 [Brassica cretica]
MRWCGVAIHAAKVPARSVRSKHKTKPLSGISGFDRAELHVSLGTHQDFKEAVGAEKVLRTGLLSVARGNLEGLSSANLVGGS